MSGEESEQADAEVIWRRQALAILHDQLRRCEIDTRELRQLTEGALSPTTLNRALRAGAPSATRRTIWVLVDALGLSRVDFRSRIRDLVVDEVTRGLAGGPVQEFPTIRVVVDELAGSTDPDLVVFAGLLRSRQVDRIGGEVLVTAEMIRSLAAFTRRTPWDCWQAVAAVIRNGASAARQRTGSWGEPAATGRS